MASPFEYMNGVTGGPLPNTMPLNPHIGFGINPDLGIPNPAQTDPETAPMWQRLEDVKQMIHTVDQAFPSEAPPTPEQPGKVPWQALVLGGLQDALTAMSINKATPQTHYTTVRRNGRTYHVPYQSHAYGPVGEFGGTAAALSMPIVNAAHDSRAAFEEWAKGKSRNDQIKGAVMTRMLDETLAGKKDDAGTDMLKRALTDGVITRPEYVAAVRAKILGDSGPSDKLLKQIHEQEAAGEYLATKQTPEAKANQTLYQKSVADAKAAETPDKAAKPDFTAKEQVTLQLQDLDKKAGNVEDQIKALETEKRAATKKLDPLATVEEKAAARQSASALDDEIANLKGTLHGLQYRRSLLVDEATGGVTGGDMTTSPDVPPLSASPSKETFPPDLKLSNGHTLQDYADVWGKLTPEQQQAVWDDARASMAKK